MRHFTLQAGPTAGDTACIRSGWVRKDDGADGIAGTQGWIVWETERGNADASYRGDTCSRVGECPLELSERRAGGKRDWAAVLS